MRSIANSRVRCATVIENVLKIRNEATNSETPAIPQGYAIEEFSRYPQIVSAFDDVTLQQVKRLFAPFSCEFVEMTPAEGRGGGKKQRADGVAGAAVSRLRGVRATGTGRAEHRPAAAR